MLCYFTACVDAVTDVLEGAGAAPGEKAEGAGAENRGESLLEPLLRGLLGGGLLGGLSAAGADVLRDVRRALGRLRDALAPPAAHPDAEKLLALADRLEDALDAADRLDGCKRRPRRRSRAARHTVGVTAGELQRAREVADREELRQDPPAPCQPSPPAPTVPSPPETRVTPPPIARSFTREEPPRKPETSEKPEARDLHRHSIADVEPGRSLDKRPERDERAFRRSKSGTEAAADQYVALRSREGPRPPDRLSRKPAAPRTWTRSPPPPSEDVPRVPLYKPPPPGYNFAAPPQPEETPRSTPSRFMRQRARMKRANTIDIPKPAGAYRVDSDTEEEGGVRGAGPVVPSFQPQTDNDRKFLAFMKKNNENDSAGNKMFGPANWTSRFGNIKNTFENRDDAGRAPWRVGDNHAYRPPKHDFEPRVSREVQLTTLQSNKENVPRVPWHRDTKPVYEQPPSPTRPPVVKPFAAKPIPMNQFSHAPMSAFKPLKKLPSPAHVWSPPSSCLVSPQPQPVDNKSVPLYKSTSLTSPKPAPVSPVTVAAPWAVGDHEKPKRVLSLAASKFETNGVANVPVAPFTTSYKGRKFTSPEAVQTPRQQYPVRAIPSQNNLAAPELVKKVDYNKLVHDDEINNFSSKIDAQKLQIEFYEKQIRQKKPSKMASRDTAVSVGKPPPPRYTVTNYTPPNVVSTFVPLQQTPDIEKASAHKVDYLPDVVLTELGQPARPPPYTVSSPGSSGSPHSPRARLPATHHNSEPSDDAEPTEHRTVTRVMRGPVSQQATITSGVRTRGEEGHLGGAAKSLKGVLQKFSSPKHDVLSQIERRKRQQNGTDVPPQVRSSGPPVHNVHALRNGYTSPPQPTPPTSTPPPTTRPVPSIRYDNTPGSIARRYVSSPTAGKIVNGINRSKESVYSNDSDFIESRFSDGKPSSPFGSVGSSPSPGMLSKSESWHQIAERAQQAVSPRKVVSRAKSMHLLNVPKLFEGGIAREEVTEKTRTVEAYFGGSPKRDARRGSEVKTRGRRPAASFTLGRSRTMPSVSELQFLDESNADDAFEDLVSALA